MSSIRDVADLAEVSTATVSHVINSTRFVSPELTQRVRAAMVQLNYQPDAVARSLRRRETLTLGLLIPSVEIPFFASVAYGIERFAAANGYSVILCNSDWDRAVESRHLQDLLARRVDGLICISAGMTPADIEPFVDAGTPVVMFEEPMLGIDLDIVGIDNRLGAYIATKHLLKLGHRRIGIITGHLAFTVSQDRLEGARRAMREAGLMMKLELVVEGDYLPAAGRQAVVHFLSLAEPPTAILSFNDLMAMGALQALAEHDLRVPEDVALIGFDDIPLSEFTNPALTTIRQPLNEMCAVAINCLLQRINGHGPEMAQHVMLKPELVQRASTASPSPALLTPHARGKVYAETD